MVWKEAVRAEMEGRSRSMDSSGSRIGLTECERAEVQGCRIITPAIG